jgi:imidazolonepropionase-like amidohydrolase
MSSSARTNGKASWILIENGTVVDGTGGPAQPRTSVLIKNNRIDAIGPEARRDRVPESDSLTIIEATGKTVMPGLIDAHCHLSFGQTRTQEEQDLYTSVEVRTLRSAWNAKKLLRAGVTSISQPGGSFFIGVGVREGIREGIVEGPRMTTAGRFITTSNGIADWYPESVGFPDSSIGTLANTRDEMVAEVRRQVKNGVDLIKIADSPFGDYQAFTDDEVKAIADMAHQLKKRVTMHARGSDEVRAGVRAELDWIMHGNSMTDEVIQDLAASQIPLVPTLLLIANFADYGDLVGTPKADRLACRRMLDTTQVTLHKAHQAGVKFVMGSDTGFAVTPYGEWHARELELLMEYAGLSSLEAIQAGTQNAAVTVNLKGEVGEVVAGRLADVLVVNGDPVRDIRVLQQVDRIETVIKNGEILSFTEEELTSHPYDRNQIYSTQDLTYNLVHADAEPHNGQTMPWSGEEGKDVATALKERERRSAAEASELVPES